MSQLFKAAPIIESSIESLKQRAQALRERKIVPLLKIILVGSNPASLIYTKNKKKFSEKIGAECEILQLDEKIPPNRFLSEIKEVVQDPKVHGCLIQLPLPPQLSKIELGHLIPPEKDVDGFHPQNLFSLLQGAKGERELIPCTPKGILTLLKFYHVDIEGNNIVVIGRSLIVGKPLSILLTNHDATVTLCHSKTKNLPFYTTNADIIVCAVGKPKFFNSSFLIKGKGPIIIDVGINMLPDNKICGDVDFDDVKNYVRAITPVPGGIGPLTIFSLAENLLIAAERNG